MPLLKYNDRLLKFNSNLLRYGSGSVPTPLTVKDMATFLETESGDDGLMIMIKPKKTFSFTTISFFSLKSRTHSASDNNVCFFGRVFETTEYSAEVDTFTDVMSYDVSSDVGTSKLKYDSSSGTANYVTESKTAEWKGVPVELNIDGEMTTAYKYTVKLKPDASGNDRQVTFEKDKVYVIGDYISTYNAGSSGLVAREMLYCINKDASCLLCKTARQIGEVTGQKCIRKTEEFVKLPYILYDNKLITDYI